MNNNQYQSLKLVANVNVIVKYNYKFDMITCDYTDSDPEETAKLLIILEMRTVIQKSSSLCIAHDIVRTVVSKWLLINYSKYGLPRLKKERRQLKQKRHLTMSQHHLSQLMRLWYLSHWRTAKAQARLRIRAVSPEPSLFAHIKYGSRRRV